MNRPGGDVALKPGRYLAEHRSTIGLGVEPYYRQENRLLERAKDVRHRDYIVAIRSSLSSISESAEQFSELRKLAGCSDDLRNWLATAAEDSAGRFSRVRL